MKHLQSIKVSTITGLLVFGITQNAIASSTMVTDAAGTKQLWTFQEVLGSQKLVSKVNKAPDADAVIQTWDTKGIIQTWDANGNLETRTDEEGRVTKYTYNATNQRETMIEAFGAPEARLTTYQYVSPDIDLITDTITPSIFDGEFKAVVNQYDANLNIESVTINGFNELGQAVARVTTFDHDNFGKVTSIDGPRTDVSDITILEYYDCNTGGKCGQLKKVTNALGHVTSYDDYDAIGRLKKMTDANGLVTEYDYHPRGWLLTMTETPPVGDVRITSYDYDNVGQLELVTFPDGSQLNYVYDEAHDLREVYDNLGNKIEYVYDSRGNRTDTLIRDPKAANESEGVLVRMTEFVYDHRNFVESINTGGSVTKMINDAVGNLSESRDPNTPADSTNPTDSSEFDALDRLDTVVDALSNSTGYKYDVADQLSEVTAPNGAVTRYTYDDLGNQRKEQSPDRGTLVYVHDGAGNVTSMTDARGITTTYKYDALNRLTDIEYADATENVVYTYDNEANCTFSVGRLCQVEDAVGTHVHSYDPWGNVVTQAWQTSETTFTVAYEYDSVNRLTQIEYPSGFVVDYVRDDIGRVGAVHSPNGTRTEIIADEFVYRADGLVTSYRMGNAQRLSRYYDLQGRLDRQELDGVEIANYVYDDNGNVENKNDIDYQREYSYDLLNRLEGDDWLGGLLGEDWSYTYDANGNRKTQTLNSNTPEVLNYSPVSNVLVDSVEGIVLSDESGNITSMPKGGDLLELTYNQQNHLSTAAIGGETANYAYNHARQRYSKNMGVDISQYIYDLNGRLIATMDDQGKVHEEYVYANRYDYAPIHHRLYEDTESSTVEAMQALSKSEANIADPVNSEGQCEGYEKTDADRTNTNVLFADSDTAPAPVTTEAFDLPPPREDLSWFFPILYYWLLLSDGEPIMIDLAGGHPPLIAPDVELLVPEEPDGEELDYIVDVATTERSLNNGPDIARYCIQEGQTTVDLNNLPLNGTRVYVRVWSKKLNGDWIFEDYEIETEEQSSPTRQVTRSYVVKDHLDTPRFIYNDEKVQTWRWASDGFGKQAANDDVSQDGYQTNFNLRFAGQYEDLESGLLYNSNRYYDPELGRYVTSDPIGLRAGFNTYGYVHGNPVKYTDPTGLILPLLVIGCSGGGCQAAVAALGVGLAAVWFQHTVSPVVSPSVIPGPWPGSYNPDDDSGSGVPGDWPVAPEDRGPGMDWTFPDDPVAPPIGADDDLGGSGDSDRARKCREACSKTHLPGEFRFRNCVRRCMLNPEEFNCE